MKVLKFGGTSVGSSDSIKQVISILKKYKDEGTRTFVVFSAMSGITNKLIETGRKAAASDENYLYDLKEIEEKHFRAVKELIDVASQGTVLAQIKKLMNELQDLMHGVFLLRELSPKTNDLLLSFGERMSCRIIAAYGRQVGLGTEYVDARQLILTDERFGHARVDKPESFHKVNLFFDGYEGIPIITGFVASTFKGQTTTLGRGGSDYTAALIGAAIACDEIEIWTDVDGVMTCDPRKVERAFSLDDLSYIEAMEMSHFGAKVIYPPTLQPAFEKAIPLRIRNTFNPNFQGTFIHKDISESKYPIKGISSIDDVCVINLTGSGMVGVPGVSSRLFGALASSKINVILITQASSEHSICFALPPDDGVKAKAAIEEEFEQEISRGKIDPVEVQHDMSVVAIIGESMRHNSGISGKVFDSLSKNGISVTAIAQGSSELNISLVIYKRDLSKTLNTVHDAFFLSEIMTLNLFIVGVGLIGSTMLQQIREQQEYLKRDQLFKINLVGLANTKKMLFSKDGIDQEKWKEVLDKEGEKSNIDHFIEKMISMNLPNAVFVDNTASHEVVAHYENALANSVSVVTPNKLAASGPYDNYIRLKETAARKTVKFLYETNVGAGLPVINTLNDLKNSGDKVVKIEGVLSGTLSYIFNSFTPGSSFSEVVKKAKEMGYTEPDPRDDLNGMDVARKILILAREVGCRLELSDIEIENVLPENCRTATDVNDFFNELEKSNDFFENLLTNVENEGKKLRFIAKLENEKANVRLEAIGDDHPFFALSGSDNIIAYQTQRYKERPLVVKGPGAGAEVTAAGVFADIITIGNYLSYAYER